MNLPNKITLIRILLLPFIVFFYMSYSFISCGKIIASVLFLIAVLTDFLDGYFARKLNQVTTLGKFLDSIADKLLVISVLVLLVADGTIMAPYGAISAIIIIFRELMVSALRQLAASKNVIVAADMWGKIKANFQFFGMLFFMILSYFITNPVLSNTAFLVIQIICYALLALTVLSTVLSGIHYVVKNKQIFAEPKTQEDK